MIINVDSYNIASNRMTLLWENENTSIAFDSTINPQINTASYRMFCVLFYPSITIRQVCTQMVVSHVGDNPLVCDCDKCRYRRPVYFVDGTHLKFGSGMSYEHNGSDGTVVSKKDDAVIIPYRVYGIY